MTEQMTPERLRSALVDISENAAELENYAIDLGAKLRKAEAERARAVDALGDIGRTAEAASGDLEDGINAELAALRAERDALAEQVKRVRDLHSPVTGLPGTGGPVCRHCVTYDGQTVPAPCDTIRALDGTEAGR
jgi:chromosome segregation ATPase